MFLLDLCRPARLALQYKKLGNMLATVLWSVSNLAISEDYAKSTWFCLIFGKITTQVLDGNFAGA